MPEKAFGCEINAAMLDVDPSSNGIIGVQYSKDMADQEAAQAVEDMEISPRFFNFFYPHWFKELWNFVFVLFLEKIFMDLGVV